MARSIREIQTAIIAAKDADATLSGSLTSTSQVAIWRLWAYVVATAIWILENMFDLHVSEVNGIISTQKPHSLQWYVTKAKAFQYGVPLPEDTDVYEVVPPIDESVLVVKYAAAVELMNKVRLKVAKDVGGGVLGALSSGELSAFKVYMGKIKDAGVRLQPTSGPADTFQPTMVIYYDPLVLNPDGSRIDGTDATPVKTAVNAMLGALPFNGVFVLNSFIAAMQAVPGVKIADVEGVQAYHAALLPEVITVQYTPDAGYMALDDGYFDAHVTYVAYGS